MYVLLKVKKITLVDYKYFYSMDQTGNSFGSNPASLKGKLQTLEVGVRLLSNKLKIFQTNSTTTRNKSRF